MGCAFWSLILLIFAGADLILDYFKETGEVRSFYLTMEIFWQTNPITKLIAMFFGILGGGVFLYLINPNYRKMIFKRNDPYEEE